MKVSFAMVNRREHFHTIFFPKSPFYEIIKDFRVNDFYEIKGEVQKTGDEHILLNIYALELLRSQEAFLHTLKAETLKPQY